MEYIVNAALVAIDRWFYVLPSPASDVPAFFVRFPTAEMMLVPLEPLVGLMTGFILMAFTSAGHLPAPANPGAELHLPRAKSSNNG
jgi:hypothetical protein